jgi:hypothetical protein
MAHYLGEGEGRAAVPGHGHRRGAEGEKAQLAKVARGQRMAVEQGRAAMAW